MRQAEIVHVADEIGLADLAAQPRIEAPLFGDAGHREAAVIVRRIEQAGRRQRQDLAAHRAVHCARVALLEIGAAAAPDQQAIAGERHALVVEDIRHTTQGMTGRRADLEIAGAELHAIAVREIAVAAFGSAGGGERDRAPQLPLQQPRAGHVIGVHVRLERGNELETQFGNERGIAPRLLEYRIDEHPPRARARRRK